MRLARFWGFCAVVVTSFLMGSRAGANADDVESTLLVRLEEPAKYVGIPKGCAGDETDEDGNPIICLMELYEAKAVVLRNFGGAKTARRLTVRFTAHSYYAVWQKGVRFLLIVFPFEDQTRKEHFAHYWDWERGGKFCVGQEFAHKSAGEPLGKLYAWGTRRVTGKSEKDWSEDYPIVCVTGREKLSQ